MSYTIIPSQTSWTLRWVDLPSLLQNLRIALWATNQLHHVVFASEDLSLCHELQWIWQQLLAPPPQPKVPIPGSSLIGRTLPQSHHVQEMLGYQGRSLTYPQRKAFHHPALSEDHAFTSSDIPISISFIPPSWTVAQEEKLEGNINLSFQEILRIVPLSIPLGQGNIALLATDFYLWLQITTFDQNNPLPLTVTPSSHPTMQLEWAGCQVKLIVEPQTISDFWESPIIKSISVPLTANVRRNSWYKSIQSFWHYFQLKREYKAISVSASDTTSHLTQHPELLHSVLQEMPIGMFQAGLDGIILSANPAFCQLTGYTLAQLRQLDLQTITESSDFELELEMIREVVQYREQRIFEKRYRKSNRDLVWAEVKLLLVGDPELDTSYFLGFATDSSDRHRIEAERIQTAQEIQNRQERETLLHNIAVRIRSAVDLPTMLQNAVEELKQALRTDRVVIYQIFSEGGGNCINEAVYSDLPHMQGQTFGSDCIPPPYLDAYRQGRIWSVSDIATAGLTDCHIQMLEQLHVKSMVATGILSMDEALLPNQRTLWGLLVVHHCHAVRTWQPEELQLIEAVANQLSIALEQTKLLNRLTRYTQELEDRVRERTKELEQSLKFEQHIRSLTECLHRDLDENLLFRTVVDGLLATLEVEACFVSFYKPEKSSFEIKFEALQEGVCPYLSVLGRPFSLDDLPIPAKAQILDGQTCVFSGSLDEATILKLISIPDDNTNLDRSQVSEVISPILDEDGLVGLLVVLRLNPHPFSPAEIKIIEQTIYYCAIALRQAQLHQQEHKHRLSAEYFRSFLDESVDVVVEYDPQLRYISINRTGCLLLNRSSQDILGRTNQEVFQSDTAVLDLPIQQTFKTGEKVYLNHEIHLPQGSRVFETVYAPISSSNGDVQRVIGICRDVTELKQQWQLLENQNHQLAETTRLKEEFVATTSHELRTPLTAILGFSNVLLQEFFGELNAKQKDYIERIYGSGQHLLDLINDILDLSRLEAGRMELDLQSVYVVDICDGVISLIQERAATQGLDLQVDIAPDVEWIVADPRRLKQMLLNLLTNAVKFTVQGSVGIRVYQQTSSPGTLSPQSTASLSTLPGTVGLIHFIVWDTGIGIHETDQQLLFTPFSQIDSSLSRKHPGTGLGLVITRKLAELHGGWVTLESSPGQGSTFTISLPLRNDTSMFQVL